MQRGDNKNVELLLLTLQFPLKIIVPTQVLLWLSSNQLILILKYLSALEDINTIKETLLLPLKLSQIKVIDAAWILLFGATICAVVVCWLAKCECISGTNLLRQFYVLPH